MSRRPLEQKPALYLPGDLHRRLEEQRQNQAAKRAAGALLGSLEGTELRAIRDLAVKYFGQDCGQAGAACVQITADKPGIVQVGYFLDRKQLLDGAMRRRVIIAEGASHREISDQLRTWKARQS